MTFPPSLLKFDPRDLNKKADTLLWPKSPTCTAPFSFPLLENLSRPHQASNRDRLAEVEGSASERLISPRSRGCQVYQGKERRVCGNTVNDAHLLIISC